MITLVLLSIVRKEEYTATNNQYDILLKQQYLLVNDTEDNTEQNNIGFDIKNQQYFALSTAMDTEKTYGFTKNKSKQDIFYDYFDFEFSIFKYLNISNKEIKESKYIVKRDIYSLLDKKELENEYPLDYEAKYLSPHYKLRQVRITYNKSFLPINVEGYYEGNEQKGWHLMRTISYPYKNQSEFDKELDEYIEYIKMYEEENEGD